MSQIIPITEQGSRNGRLLIRLDLNVTFIQDKISDDKRLREATATIKALSRDDNVLIIMAHLGRPKGKPNPEFSLSKVKKPLEDLIGKPITFIDDPLSEATAEEIKNIAAGSVVLLENLRYFAEEEANDAAFSKKLARLADCYVNDAFSVSHRAHASTHGVSQYLDSFGGPNLIQEVTALQQVVDASSGTRTLVIGGAKVSTKIGIIRGLLKNIDHIIIGGAMANTFLFAEGRNIGKSLYESDAVDIVQEIYTLAEQHQCRVHLPKDIVVADRLDFARAQHKTFDITNCPTDGIIVDAGMKSVAHNQAFIDQSNTVLWNGPMGAFEYPPFDAATNALALHVATRTQQQNCISVAGGGDTYAALNNANAIDGFSHVSSAGGAFLEWLEFGTLPGLEALKK